MAIDIPSANAAFAEIRAEGGRSRMFITSPWFRYLEDLGGGSGASGTGGLPTVVTYGATGDGATDDEPSFTAAALANYAVIVPPGTYFLGSTPTLASNLLEILPGAVLTGPGAAALGYATGAISQFIQTGSSATDFATAFFRRYADYTGGTPGFTNAALWVQTETAAGAAAYEWNAVFKLLNAATGGQNVAAYFQSDRMSGAGPTWAQASEAFESTAEDDPIVGLVTNEGANRSNGTDANDQRVIFDAVATRYDPTGPATECGYGFRVQNGGDASAMFRQCFGAAPGTTAFFVFDAVNVTALIAGARFAQGQPIVWNAAATHKTYYDGNGFVWEVPGGVVSMLDDNGGIELNMNAGPPMLIDGTTNTGGTLPVFSANKPGAASTIGLWASIVVGGTQYWMALWDN